ncbi:MAG: efflux RND transporter permease subunit [Pseudomonadota bacterium]|nr:efflux RND transporter permease subunit [Pseudomonadota bacterium]
MEARKTVVFLMVILIAIGSLTFVSIPKDAEPDIDVPFIYVSVILPGISPEDSERLLVRPLETELKNLEGLEEISGMASQDYGSVLLEFDISFDKDKVLADVREKVDLAKSEFPSDAEEPMVLEFNMATMPVMTVSLSGKVPDRTLIYHAKELQNELERIPGVLEAPITGDREELLEILVSPTKLENYDVSLANLIRSITGNNRIVAAGSIDKGQGKFSVKVPAVYESAQDVYNIGIITRGEGTVKLGDIAEIRSTFKDNESYARIDGKPAIHLDIKKRIGENVIIINKKIREAGNRYKEENLPNNIFVDFSADTSDYINEMITSLQNAITNAIVCVMILVIASLGFRSALMVGISIPTSFLMAITLLALSGGYVNMMVMFGLLVSVGLLVDGSIVMVEYADRKMAEGLNRKEAYTQAYKRMIWPILSSTATTLAAFLPLVLWPGIPGQFMKWMPFMVSLVLISSLFSALIFIPVMGSLFGKTEQINTTKLDQEFNFNKLKGFTLSYARLLEKCLQRPVFVLGSAVIVVFTLIILYSNFNAGSQYSVDTDSNQMLVHVNARGNLSPEEKLDLSVDVEEIVMNVDGVDRVLTSIGSGDGFNVMSAMGGSGNRTDQIASLMIELYPVHERRSADEIKQDILNQTKFIAGIIVEAYKIENKPDTGKDIQLEITSSNSQNLETATKLLTAKLETMEGIQDVDNTMPLPGIEWIIKVDRELAGRFGADISTIGAIVQLVTNGILVDKYRPDNSDDEVDIRVRFPEEYRMIEEFDKLRIPTNAGAVPLSNFVTREPSQKVSTIERLDGMRIFKIRANTSINPLTGKKFLSINKSNELQEWIDQQDFPNNVSIKFAGSNEEREESAAFLGNAMIGALFLMFIILLTQFNSFYQAIITLSTVILSTIGALTGIMIVGQYFSVIMTGLGIVSLAGIIVNNSIVLIDTYNRLRNDHDDPLETILHSAVQRFRPIILTTATTMIALIPVALQITIGWFDRSIEFGGLMAAWWVPFSTAVIWGLGFSSVLTLFLVPTLLSMPIYFKRNKYNFINRLKNRIQPAE